MYSVFAGEESPGAAALLCKLWLVTGITNIYNNRLEMCIIYGQLSVFPKAIGIKLVFYDLTIIFLFSILADLKKTALKF